VYFSKTAAHEITHGFLTYAFGYEFSWSHKQTTTITGTKLYTISAPVTGEIDLMKYYAPVKSADLPGAYNRTVIHEDDLKTILLLSKRD
jgi:hypothetical protein